MEVCCYNLELKERVAFLVQASSLKKPNLPPCPCQERIFISLGTSMSHIFWQEISNLYADHNNNNNNNNSIGFLWMKECVHDPLRIPK
jgi:hypothetical protein